MKTKSSDDIDADFMRSAISLAARGLGTTFPNPAVGCLIVKEGVVVGRGWTQPGGRPHAETQALAQAGEAARGATAYVTLEPCAHTGQTPPCANALVDAKIARLVVAITDPDPRVAGLGLRIIKQAGLSVTENICRDEAWRANLGFFLSLTKNRPMFTLKLATDALGHIPGPGAVGADKWVTSPQARNRGHLLRSTHDAVLFGIGTVLSDDPKYTCRLSGLEQTSPVRVVLDSQLRLSLSSNLLKTADVSPIWVICGQDAQTRDELLRPNITIIRSPQSQPDPTWVATELARRGLTRVLIESGPKIVTAFLEAGLVDEVAWFRANKVLDKNFVPAFHDKLLEKLELCLEAVLQAGPDHLELYAKGL